MKRRRGFFHWWEWGFHGLIAGFLLFLGTFIGFLLHRNYSERKHCTKWGTERVLQSVCISPTTNGCLQSEGRWVDQAICLERDDL